LNFIIGDHLGSSSLTTDAAGNELASMRYKAWGETRYATGSMNTDYQYTGQRTVGEIGLHFYNARWYDSSLSRFAQADTIIPSTQGVQAWDRFAYTNNNPLRYTDPSGHGVDCGLGESCVTDPYTSPLSGSTSSGGGGNSGSSGGGQACSGQYQSIMCPSVEDTPFTLPNTPMIPLPDLSNLPLLQSSPSNPAPDPNKIVDIFRWGIDTLSLLELWEFAENYGRPVYKHVKFALPLGPLEYGVDAGLQIYDDRKKEITIPQRMYRGAVRFGESAVIDGFSHITGLGVAAGTAGWGYPVGSYLFSNLSDGLVTNHLNPSLFSRPFFGGLP
jgi:RHS repeat-associated protein